MKILVCVKHVMDSESMIRIIDSEEWIEHSSSTRFEMNQFDAYAIEEALQIKEAFPDSRIHAITVGPDHAANTLRRALGMGVDEGIHIVDNSSGYRPPLTTASWIASHAANEGYDLILTGIMSSDEMNSQTGPMSARILSMPCCSATICERISSDQKTVSVEREIEGGARDLFDIKLPCVLSIQTGINHPRYPALSKVLRAKRKELEIIDSDSFDKPETGIILKNIFYPEKTKKGVFLNGAMEDKVDQLIDVFEKKALLG